MALCFDLIAKFSLFLSCFGCGYLANGFSYCYVKRCRKSSILDLSGQIFIVHRYVLRAKFPAQFFERYIALGQTLANSLTSQLFKLLEPRAVCSFSPFGTFYWFRS